MLSIIVGVLLPESKGVQYPLLCVGLCAAMITMMKTGVLDFDRFENTVLEPMT